MLAQLAAADGHEVTALDRFGDVDLRAIAPGRTARTMAGLATAAEGVEAEAVVYGAGFENRPDLVRRLAGGRELLGTPPDRLAAVRDPWQLAAAVRAAGASFPETVAAGEAMARSAAVAAGGASEPLGDGEWLRKPRRGGGGRGVRRWRGGRLRPTEIVQRHVRGLSCSAVAVGDGRRAVVLGVTEQLHPAGGFQWCGNVTPPRLPDGERAALTGGLRSVCAQVAARFGVCGAFGVDAIWDGRRVWVLEVNPRPPAALELFDAGRFAVHVRAARGAGLPSDGATAASGCERVKLVLFADRCVRAPEPGWWPAGLVRDIPHAGETILRGAPVCTLVSAAAGPEGLAALGRRLLAALPGAVPGALPGAVSGAGPGAVAGALPGAVPAHG